MEKVQDNFKAKYLLTCALSRSKFDQVSVCKIAKDIWDNLSLIYESSSLDEKEEANEVAHLALTANTNSDSSEDESEKNVEPAHLALMTGTNSDWSKDELEVNPEPSKLEKDFENLLRDSYSYCSLL